MAAGHVAGLLAIRRRHAIQTTVFAREQRPAPSPWLLGQMPVPRSRDVGTDHRGGAGFAARAIAAGHGARLPATSIIQLQRTIGNASVTSLLVARCPAGEVPDEGCADCGQPAVQRRATDPATAQRQAGGRPTIRRGSSGPAVTELQTRLVEAGASIKVDGIFGGATLEAVKAAQSAAGLTIDGVVGPRTWGALDAGVRLPGGGMPPRGYAELLDQVRTALGTIRGSTGANVAPAPGSAIGSLARGAARVTAPNQAGRAPAREPTSAPAVQREDDEDESWWDQASGAAGSAWDAASESAGQAWDYASQQAGAAWNYASEQAGAAWQQANGSGGGAGGGTSGSEGGAGGGAWESGMDAAEELWHGASEVISSFADDVAAIPGQIREQFGEEIEVLEQVIAELGRGFRLSDDEVTALSEVVTGLMPGLDPEVVATTESTCAAATQDVAFTQSSFKVSFEGLSDLNTKVLAKLGGSGTAGHVKLAAFPTFKVTCWDGTGPTRTVGAAKVTAKGSATFPTPAEPDSTKWKTQSADRPRELIGIKDYFSIVSGHEGSHVKIYKDAFDGAANELIGLTESAAKIKFNSIVCEAFKSQDSLDNSEGCVEVFGNPAKDSTKAPAKTCGMTPDAASSCP
jgi:hypothetical protein